MQLIYAKDLKHISAGVKVPKEAGRVLFGALVGCAAGFAAAGPVGAIYGCANGAMAGAGLPNLGIIPEKHHND
jgi:hypothetical protein